ncbi:hypothetical protein VNO77_05904 [Canavalia gladiata]|uniref:Uncharacterized protein n=1 Tax=Canavalia gladiata TaxID=3824 RepID=A0AAN9MZ68_CANGL
MDNRYSTPSNSTQSHPSQEASSLKKRFLKRAKEHRSRLYILKRCIIMLLCWQNVKEGERKDIISHEDRDISLLLSTCVVLVGLRSRIRCKNNKKLRTYLGIYLDMAFGQPFCLIWYSKLHAGSVGDLECSFADFQCNADNFGVCPQNGVRMKAVLHDPKALCYLIEPCQYHIFDLQLASYFVMGGRDFIRGGSSRKINLSLRLLCFYLKLHLFFDNVLPQNIPSSSSSCV